MRSTGVAVAIAMCLVSGGCGRSDLPELGYVTGTVKLDGKPLPNVMVQFHSDAGGRPGTGMTDSEGNYELVYTTGAKGTKVGPSRVELTTVWPEGEPPPGQKEQIPAKYNSASMLKEDVKPGRNTFDFDLTSK
jgi:hypothetical protein